MTASPGLAVCLVSLLERKCRFRGWIVWLVGFALSAFLPVAQAQRSQVVTWGYNGSGQTNTPVSLTNAVLLDGGQTYTLALRSDGRLMGWGDNYYGTLTPPPDLSNVVSFVSGGYFNVALRANGTIAAFGGDDYWETNVPAGLSNVVAVAAGNSHTLVLMADGTLRSWGSPSDLPITTIPPGAVNVTAIAAGENHSVALLADGRVIAWGYNSYGQTDVPAGLSNVVAIAAGFYQNYALRANGSVIAWGRSSDGSNLVPISVPASATNLADISVGNYHALGLRRDGSILTWGHDSNLGANSPPVSFANVVAVASGGYHNAVVISTNLLHLPNRLPNVGIHAGGTLHLRVSPVTSTGARYQWSRNGVELPGQTNAALLIPGMQPPVAGLYSVIVSNAAGLAVSDDALVDVLPFWIVGHPTNYVRYRGGSVTFTARVLGNGLSYQWKRNGTNLTGSTQPNLTLTNLQLSHTGEYTLYVSNSLGSANTTTGRLDVVNVAAWGRNLEQQCELWPGLTSIASVKAGGSHNLALRHDGTVVAWGGNLTMLTNVPAGLTNVTAIAAGGAHSLALRSDGTIVGWGWNDYGQTNPPVWLSNVVIIAAGSYNNAAIRSDGMLFSWWGYANVTTASNMVDVAGTPSHTLGLRADGRVLGWGNNLYGETDTAGLSNVVAIAAGDGFDVALHSDGTVTAWGENSYGQTNVPAGLSNVVTITAGGRHALAQRADGSVVRWGDTNYNHAPPSDLAGIAELSAGGEHNVALLDNGPPHLLKGLPDRYVPAGDTAFFTAAVTGKAPLRYQWRYNGTNLPGATNAWFAQPNLQFAHAGLYSVEVSNALGSVVSREAMLGVMPFFISAQLTNQIQNVGSKTTLAVQLEGNGPFHYQWLFNGSTLTGATNAALVLENLQPEQAGFYSVIISNSYGALTSGVMQLELPWVTMWGRYSDGTIPLPVWITNVVAVAQGSSHTLALRPDGTVLALGFYNYGATNVPAGLSDVAAVSAGGYFSVALRSNGTVTAWGRSDLGSLNVPPGLNGVLSISAGGQHTLALRTNGTVVAWGYASGGLLIVPPNLTNVVEVAGGGDRSLALQADGTVVGWGENNYVPFWLADVVAIAAGYSHSLALQANGTVSAWGANHYGQLNVPATATNIVAIDAGGYHNMALRADGEVICWGYDGFGQTTVPPGLTNVAEISGGGIGSLALLGAGSPYVRTRVASRTIQAGGKTFFSAQASGARPLSVQWQLNGVNISGATNGLLVLTNVLPPQAGAYTCVFSNRYGVVSTAPATLTIPPFRIDSHPQSQTQYAGGIAIFSTSVSGPSPFTYQWQFFGTNLPGATEPQLMLTNLQVAQSGPYSVAISNVWGGMVSSNAQLTVIPLFVTLSPTNSSVFSGGTAIFSAAVQGASPLYYQWQRAGVDIPGATTSTLVLTNIQSAQAGSYTLRISNTHGAVVTAPANLSVSSVVSWGSTSAFSGVTGIVMIAAGEAHRLALRRNGTVVAEGVNADGQLNVPANLTNVQAVACGRYHSLALRSDGTVVAWGRNDYGQTNVPATLNGVAAVAGGGIISLALRTNGTVVVWGYLSNVPTNEIAALQDIVSLSLYSELGVALRANGTLWNGWANGAEPIGLSNAIAVAAGTHHKIALRADGTVYAWGHFFPAQTNTPANLANVTAIASGGFHNLALLEDRTVVAWGTGFARTNVPVGLTNVTMVAAGESESLALLGDGAPFVYTPSVSRKVLVGTHTHFYAAVSGALPMRFQWLFNGNPLPGATNATLRLPSVFPSNAGEYALVASNSFGAVTSAVATLTATSALFESQVSAINTFKGNVLRVSPDIIPSAPVAFQWRFNDSILVEQTNAMLEVKNLQLDQAGSYSLVASNLYGAVTSAPVQVNVGLVAAWGYNYYGQTNVPAGLHDATQIGASSSAGVALKRDGSFKLWGSPGALTNLPPDVLPAKSLATGSGWLVALRTNGTVAAWGAPYRSENTNVPAGLSNVIAVAAGELHSLALRKNGTVAGWGYNYYNQVNPPFGLSNVVAIACGAQNNLALRADGTIVAWGGNNNGQNNVPSDLTNVVAIVAGDIHCLALRADGRVVAWGYNGYGQTNVPVDLTNAVAIGAGALHSLAIRNDGTLVAWGENDDGQSTVPVALSNVVSAVGNNGYSLALVGDGPPTLSEGLADRSVLAGTRTYFTAKASGELPLSYQWKFFGTNVAGATNAVMFLSYVLPEHAGLWSVTVSNSFGEVTSDSAALFVSPLRISVQPTNRTQFAGGSTTFAVGIEGVGPFSYQWQFFGTNLPGATNASLALTNLQFEHAGTYSVVVTNAAGAVVSAAAHLTVVPIIISGQPSSRSVIAGVTTNLSVVASGTPALRYQWRLFGTNLPGATNGILSLPNVQPHQAGAYTVVITNAYGAITSQVAALTVNSVLTLGSSYSGVGQLTNSLPGIAISAGGSHALMLLTDRTVYGWGFASDGQLTIPASATNLMAVAAGIYHSLALRSNGTVMGWGGNSYGQTTIPAGLSNVIAIAAGRELSLALRADGTVAGWGFGQVPFPPGLSNVVAIGAGAQHGLALRADGTLAAWGNNPYGQTTIPPTATNVVAIAAGHNYNLALRADGTVVSWGQYTSVPAQLSNVVAIAAGARDNLALRADGTVFGWGYNLGPGSIVGGSSNFVAVACGNEFSLLLGGTGLPFILNEPPDRSAFKQGLLSFKANVSGQRPLQYQWTYNGVDVAGATNSLLALNNVMPWQAGDYSLRISNALGAVTSRVARLVTSAVITWGQFYNGSSNAIAASIGGLTNVVMLAAGEDHGVALRENRTVISWGNNQSFQLTTPAAVQFRAATIAAGGNHSLALLTNGLVYGWGRNTYGQTTIPVGLSNVVAVAAGRDHSLALRFDGTVTSWGRYWEGQTNVPAGLANVVGVAASANYSLALRADGKVVAWGDGTATNVPANLTDVVALAGGLQHALALQSDGRVRAWGTGAATNVPPGLSNVVAIAAGEQHSFALRTDGRVVAWGLNSRGQTNVPSSLSNVVALASGADMGLALVGNGKPGITLPAFHHVTAPAANAQLLVLAVGGNLSYQWQRDGVDIPGATNRLLQLNGNAYTGTYRVVISNAFGITYSQPSRVTAIPMFEMTQGPGLTTNGFHLRLLGLSGRNYVILLTSTNLSDWTPLHTNVPVFGVLEYLDRTATNQGQRFYRAFESDVALGPLRITSVQLDGNGEIRIDVAGLTGLGSVGIWASSNLFHWQPVLTNPPQIGTRRFTAGQPDAPVRFYRAQEQR